MTWVRYIVETAKMNYLVGFSDFFALNEDSKFSQEGFFPASDNFQKGRIPIYNSFKLSKFADTPPEAKVKDDSLVDAAKILLDMQTEGVIDEIIVTADIPTQGKSAPKYLVDELEVERKRIRDKILAPYGGRIEASDYPTTACEKCGATGKITQVETQDGEEVTVDIDCPNCQGKGMVREKPAEFSIFVDTEYKLIGIESMEGKTFLIGLPVSKKTKMRYKPELAEYYKTYILPRQVQEIEYQPY